MFLHKADFTEALRHIQSADKVATKRAPVSFPPARGPSSLASLRPRQDTFALD